MIRRILRYVVIWLIILAILCVLSIIKYRYEIMTGISDMFSSIVVSIIILAGIVYIISLMFRRR